MTHKFFVVVRTASGETVFEEQLADFGALYEDVAFRAVCAGTRENDGGWAATGVEPVWDEHRLTGVTVCINGLMRRYGLSVFADEVLERLAAHRGRRDGDCETDEEFPMGDGTIGVRCVACEDQPAHRRASIRRQPYPLLDRADCGVRVPPRDVSSVRAPLFIASDLDADLRAASARSLDEERADFLTGYVVREVSGAASVVALGRIEAETATTQSLVHFGFSAQTFAAARLALDRRGTDQVIVGWHHNHPPPCGRECLQTVPACTTDYVFFSVADRTVHRRGFLKPYMVALVSGKGANRRADDPIVRAYGWRNGLIRERQYAVF